MAKFVLIFHPIDEPDPEPEDLAITTTSPLMVGTANEQYSVTFQATGGSTPYTWSVISGSVPAGLSPLTSAGVLTGTPTTAGTTLFTVRVTDSAGVPDTADLACSLTVQPAAAGVSVVNTVLTGGTVGVAYTATLTATGGTGPYTFQHVSGKPTWMTIASNGSITGTPDAAAVSSIIVTATDSLAAVSPQKTLSLTIVAALSMTTMSPLASGQSGVAYSVTLDAAGGVPPYTWSIQSGAFPTPLTLSSSTGLISGTPNESGTFSVTIRVADNGGSTPIDRAFDLTMAAAQTALAVVQTSIPGGKVGVVYPTTTMRATGGTTPYTWAVSSGALPTGVALVASTGVISGTPTLAGTYTFTIRVTDNVAATAFSGDFVVTIATAALAITTGALPNAEVAAAYGVSPTVTLAATGGTAPYTWAFVSDNPAWLNLTAGTGALTGTPTGSPVTESITFRVTDSLSETITKAITLRVFAAGTVEDPHAFFDFWRVHATAVASRVRSLRNQAQVDLLTKAPAPAIFFTYYTDPDDDDYGTPQDGVKFFKPPRRWFRNVDGDGNFVYGAPMAALGIEGDENLTGALHTLTFPLGAGPVNGWTSATIVFDVWWGPEWQTMRDEDGQPNASKAFFVYTGAGATSLGGTTSYYCHHEMFDNVSAAQKALGAVSTWKTGPAGITPTAAGVTDREPFTPSGLGALDPLAYKTKHSMWTRYWYHFTFAQDGAAFTDWVADGNPQPVGTYDMVSMYACNESETVQTLLYKVPWKRNDAILSMFSIRFDSSTTTLNGNEQQEFHLGDIEPGDTFTLICEGQETALITYVQSTSNLDPNVARIDDALVALSTVSSVTVQKPLKPSGTVPDTSKRFRVQFNGIQAQTDIPMMSYGQTNGFTPSPASTGSTALFREQRKGENYGLQGPVVAYFRNYFPLRNYALADGDPILVPPVGGDGRV
jgi:hypothetical protein